MTKQYFHKPIGESSRITAMSESEVLNLLAEYKPEKIWCHQCDQTHPYLTIEYSKEGKVKWVCRQLDLPPIQKEGLLRDLYKEYKLCWHSILHFLR